MNKIYAVLYGCLLIGGCDAMVPPSQEELISAVNKSTILSQVRTKVLSIHCEEFDLIFTGYYDLSEQSENVTANSCKVKIKADENVYKQLTNYSTMLRFVFDPIREERYALVEEPVSKGDTFEINVKVLSYEDKTTGMRRSQVSQDIINKSYYNIDYDKVVYHQERGTVVKGSQKYLDLVKLNDIYPFYRRHVTSKYEGSPKEPIQASPASNFIVSPDGWARHKPTGLTWKRCVEGQSFNQQKSICEGAIRRFSAADILLNTNEVFEGGWRLPTAAEFATLLEQRKDYLKINNDVFPGLYDLHYISSGGAYGLGYSIISGKDMRRKVPVGIWTTTRLSGVNLDIDAKFFIPDSEDHVAFAPDGTVNGNSDYDIARMSTKMDFQSVKYAILLVRGGGFQALVAEGKVKKRKKESRTSSYSFNGEWKGYYTCEQVLTAMTLIIDAAKDGKMNATFKFYPTLLMNKSVPRGSYKLKGTFTNDGVFTLSPDAWIQQPEGYRMVGLKGNQASYSHLFGRIQFSGCSMFDLRKVGIKKEF